MLVTNLFETRQTLTELDWYERSPLADILRRHRGRWVHFSRGAPNRDIYQLHQNNQLLPTPDRPANTYSSRAMKAHQRQVSRINRMNATEPVPKIGVNPRKFHRDPFGIYFYPVDWVLSGTEKLRRGDQYGQDMPVYHIADIDLSSPGVVLGSVRWEQVEEIAARNGWRDQLDAFRALPPEQQKATLPRYSNPDKPGAVLWHFVERLVAKGETTWAKAYRGLTYIRDDGNSIIHSNEPDQLLVLDPRIIKVVETGQNPVIRDQNRRSDTFEHWRHAIVSLLKTLRGEFGGEIVWKDKMPKLTFRAGIAEFDVTPEKATFGAVGLAVRYRYGRASDTLWIGSEELEDLSMSEIIARVVKRVRLVSRRKTDLLFKPFLSEEEAKRFLSERVTRGVDFEWRTAVTNDTGDRYRSLAVTGERSFTQDGIPIRLKVYLSAYEGSFRASAELHIGRATLYAANDGPLSASAETSVDLEMDAADLALDVMVAKFNETTRHAMKSFGPEGYGDSYKRFTDPEELKAAFGYIVGRCGMWLDGRLREDFAEEIAAYEALDERRRRDIHYDIGSKLRDSYY